MKDGSILGGCLAYKDVTKVFFFPQDIVQPHK